MVKFTAFSVEIPIKKTETDLFGDATIWPHQLL